MFKKINLEDLIGLGIGVVILVRGWPGAAIWLAMPIIVLYIMRIIKTVKH